MSGSHILSLGTYRVSTPPYSWKSFGTVQCTLNRYSNYTSGTGHLHLLYSKNREHVLNHVPGAGKYTQPYSRNREQGTYVQYIWLLPGDPSGVCSPSMSGPPTHSSSSPTKQHTHFTQKINAELLWYLSTEYCMTKNCGKHDKKNLSGPLRKNVCPRCRWQPVHVSVDYADICWKSNWLQGHDAGLVIDYEDTASAQSLTRG